MGTKESTEATKVEKPRRNTVQQTKEKVLGDFPKIKYHFKINDIVYFTAYPKKNPNCFFTCKGIVQTITTKNNKAVYRVKIIEVGEKPILCPTQANPEHLLNKIIAKRDNELSKYISPLMTPKKWIK